MPECNLIHGDAVEVLKTFNDCSIDLIITDPPYGISYKSNSQNYNRRKEKVVIKDIEDYFEQIENDDVFDNLPWLTEAFRVLKDNTAIYIFCHWSQWSHLEQHVRQVGFKVKNMIVVHKTNHGLGDLTGSFAPKHELLMFASKGRHILNKRVPDVWNGRVLFSGSKRLHPNQKPSEWIENAILCSSKEGDLLLDPFCGSGSFLVAFQAWDRRAIGIDVDEHYYDIAKSRLKKII